MEHDITYEIALMAILGGNNEEERSDRQTVSDDGLLFGDGGAYTSKGTARSGKDIKK